ncbi:hypothetical protein HPB49_007952 [Dermacentor silvarum]|uniref:Uncharacterized protein n=1 Tax=Dermacentor silvarum TaxID=543639 RepID=A0ACB8C2N9_DERSI|nr:hypothetical protein HPB49_007952 [Dermacentor silvarum]
MAENPFGHTERQPALTKTAASSPRRSCTMPDASRPHRGRVNHPTNLPVRTTKKPKPPQQPQLPTEDIKIIVRPRDGLNVSKLSDAQIRDEVLQAAAVPIAEAEDYIYRSCVEKNVIAITTLRMANAEKYNRIRELQIGDTHYEATAYTAPPADTYKGIIHNIPDYDTAEDITKSLICKKNPTILQARRMDNTNLSSSLKAQRGAEYRCYLHKKKSKCAEPAAGSVIARTCALLPTRNSAKTGAHNPADSHNCNPKCAVCGKDHPTGDKSCQRRFQMPFLIKQRQWEKQWQQQQTLHNHSGGGRDPSLPPQGGKQTTADQCPSLPPIARHPDQDPHRDIDPKLNKKARPQPITTR